MIRFASINIEGDTHLDSVISFLKDFKPDVVCFQEIIEASIPLFEQKLGLKGYFMPVTMHSVKPFDSRSPIGTFGIGLFSKLFVSEISRDYYAGGVGDVPRFVEGQMDETVWRALFKGTVSKDNESYVVAGTHFTWTPNGSTSDKQREDLKKLLKIVGRFPELILCGDFNAPRGGEIFNTLSEKYKDNIPPQYLSSLDRELHRIGKQKQLMVDGLFTTPQYIATEVKLSEGVSDHMAITALISRT